MKQSPPADARETTSDLLDRARAGDEAALNLLFERHLPPLQRWASGRLPRWSRDIADTADLIQGTVVDVLKHLDKFEHRADGALQAYLRQAVLNRIRNELRKMAIRGPATAIDSAVADSGTAPDEAAMRQQLLDRYEAGLERLTDQDREAVVSRVELGLSYAEIADALALPSANAARMRVVRALVRLAGVMSPGH